MTPAAGRLLVATPGLIDPNFYRTVVLLIEHDEDGTLGLVLNRPLDIRVEDYLEDWALLAGDQPVVFAGGPVQPEVALAVAAGPAAEGDLSAVIVGDIRLIDLDMDPAGAPFERLRVFSGYSAWAPGQLAGELEEDAWWIFDSEPGDPFVAEPHRLWSEVLRRQHGKVALFSTLPDDPGWN